MELLRFSVALDLITGLECLQDPTSEGQTIDFHLERKFFELQNNAFNKVIAMYYQLRLDLGLAPQSRAISIHQVTPPQHYLPLLSESQCCHIPSLD